MSTPIKILAVDDNHDGLYALEEVLKKHGFLVTTAQSGTDALGKLDQENPDIILLDVNMPAPDGFEVTRRLKADPYLRYIPVVLLTANDDLDSIVQGLELGADDYVRKPFNADELVARVRAAMRTRRLYQELQQSRQINQELQQRLETRASMGMLVGSSTSMRELYSLIDKVKDSDAPVLVTGESGTGKELVASALHYCSIRKSKPFVVQNCSAFNDNLLESELFGHVRGAFTGAVRDKQGLFEVADGGTFFLDELGEMSPALQVKLLRVLQDGTFTPVGATKPKQVSVRVVAATNRDLKAMVKAGTFRQDLYYRLNVVNLVLTPLRERRTDIPMLVDKFLKEIASRSGKPIKQLDPDALRFISNYNWPGNVRELQNEIERVVLMAGDDHRISSSLLSAHIKSFESSELPKIKLPQGSLKEAVERLEKDMLRDSLVRNSGNKSESAKELGISRSSLIAKVKEYQLEDVD